MSYAMFLTGISNESLGSDNSDVTQPSLLIPFFVWEANEEGCLLHGMTGKQSIWKTGKDHILMKTVTLMKKLKSNYLTTALKIKFLGLAQNLPESLQI